MQDLPPQLHAEVKALANVEVINLLRQIDLFADLDDVILNKLIVSLRSQFLPPNECVCMEGELGRHVYIIRKGICKVRCTPKRLQPWCACIPRVRDARQLHHENVHHLLCISALRHHSLVACDAAGICQSHKWQTGMQVTVKGKRVAFLSAGDCFGEAVLYHNNVKRTASIYTRTYAQIFLLSKNAVNVAFAAHPAAYAELRRKARSKLQNYAASRLPTSRSFSNQSSTDGSVSNAPQGPGMSVESTRKSLFSGPGETRGSSM